ncbi:MULTISPECIES: FAD-dependent oxidoreductase [Bacillaceae]|jgi:electron transfer flavoprotein-quinone oxidoreductase|uniref:Nitrogen fixation protein FixC n=1 Tax=Gottfriedia luciferensis TaxID=178774 RepID=A0ABX2ZNU9_9BACI|nr:MULTISPECIES: FAD-dependent oxidoreductase [Bacillaceae]ODG91415.1 nitrogen fixation protein FixC [Gottfriedia luciferensis]PEC51151.1 FAD-dependent oxidoreductase [Bacillus sp. AFS096315]PET68371.1 FAD-dependent oxidoreductase [Bacillus sp. AFS001701]PFH84898.1 FAD-dependent oxidoreductase [Bacillus sp. AFS088145]PFM77538.1 FAD-dependent oxidoreductase [Bacillus sp. AFS077874]
MPEKFDVIVVGAGPAGISCAYELAKNGVNVVLIERGEYPGSKNVMGGVLYRKMMEDVIPEFWKDAPIERVIVEQRVMMLDKQSATTFGYKGLEFAEEPYNNFTVLRSKFDQWFAQKAVEQGALLINETVVLECIVENDMVVGVRTDRPDGDLYADVVVLADGVNSLLGKSLGFHKEWRPDEVALATMEILKLDSKIIQDRFGLEGNQGVAIELFGDATKGIVGTGFLYTNKDSLSIGVGTLLSGMIENKLKPYDLLEYVKNHPMIRPYIQGSEPQEYLAHLIPEGGYKSIPKLVGNGVLVIGDAAQLVNAIHREGSNMAMTSGRLAAETIIEAKAIDNYSDVALKPYADKLLNSFVGQDLKKYKDATHHFEKFPQYFEQYIPLLNKSASQMFTVDGKSKWEKQKNIMSNIGGAKAKLKLAKDVYKAWKVMK